MWLLSLSIMCLVRIYSYSRMVVAVDSHYSVVPDHLPPIVVQKSYHKRVRRPSLRITQFRPTGIFISPVTRYHHRDALVCSVIMLKMDNVCSCSDYMKLNYSVQLGEMSSHLTYAVQTILHIITNRQFRKQVFKMSCFAVNGATKFHPQMS